jgi:hypothetical protein
MQVGLGRGGGVDGLVPLLARLDATVHGSFNRRRLPLEQIVGRTQVAARAVNGARGKRPVGGVDQRKHLLQVGRNADVDGVDRLDILLCY